MTHSRRTRHKLIRDERSSQVRAASAVIFTVIAIIFICHTNKLSLGHINFHMPTTKVHAQAEKIISPLSQYGFPFEVSPTPTQALPVLTPSTNVTWPEFIESAKRIAPIYKFPLKVMIAQAALESARGSSEYARERNNYFGIAAYDWNPDNAFTFENVEQGIIEYILLVKRNFPEAWNNRDNPETMVELLENNSWGMEYATDPDYVYKVTHTPEWSNY